MKRNKLISIASAAAFVGMGIAAAMLGPTFQALSQRFQMPLENSGIFPGLQFLGASVTVVLTGRLVDRMNVRFLLASGTLLLGSGLLILAFAPVLVLALVGVLIVGLGYGMLDVGINTTIAAISPERTGAALNTLNAFYGLGAIIGPQLVNFALSQDNFTLAYIITGILMMCLAVPFSLTSLHIHPQGAARQSVSIRWILLLPFAILLFSYVGAEVGFSSWISTQVSKVVLVSDARATIPASLFWVGLTISRGLGNPILRRITEKQLLIASILIVSVGIIVLLAMPASEGVALVCAFIVGFGCGPVFPTALGIAGDAYPAVRGTASGILMAIGTVGGFIVPWVQGLVGGGTSGGMPVVLIMAIVMLGVGLWVYQQKPQPSVVRQSA